MTIAGVDLVMWLERDARERPREAVVANPERGELRFAPGGAVRDPRGERWQVSGALEVLGARIEEPAAFVGRLNDLLVSLSAESPDAESPDAEPSDAGDQSP